MTLWKKLGFYRAHGDWDVIERNLRLATTFTCISIFNLCIVIILKLVIR